MSRQINRLSARTAATLAKPGRHADGGGLYLVVDKTGGRRWVFLFRYDGKAKEMGLGGLSAVPLARARELAANARAAVQQGLNPIEVRDFEPKRVPTFGEAADEFIETMKPQFRNEKHVAQWAMTLTEYAAPMRDKPVDQIGTDDVMGVLKPMWLEKPETAARLRGRIERVLDAAKASGHRSGENPALWRGHLANLLPKRRKLSRGHHAALPYLDVPAFVTSLQEREAVSARSLEFTILTAARTGEALGAQWKEIDRAAAVWTVPGDRMKAGRAHRVPLSSRAVEILDEMAAFGTAPDGYVFPGHRRGRPLSNAAMEMTLRRMKSEITVHGFRSSFRDWCFEVSHFPREVAEAALAHVVGDATERAYRRGDALEKRRQLMEEWAAFCAGAPKVEKENDVFG